MEAEYNKLLNVIRRFQPYIENAQLKYLFVAPSEKKAFDDFFKIAGSQPNLTNTYRETLTDNKQLIELLKKHFSNDTKLDVYITTNEPIMIKEKLRDYINRKGIDFEY